LGHGQIFGFNGPAGFTVCSQAWPHFNPEQEPTMRLNHANLVTSEVAALAGFFTNHFGFTLLDMRGKDAFAILSGSEGFALNLMKPGKGEDATYPDGFHIGFFVDETQLVHAKYAELARAGREPGDVQELTRGGVKSTTFYCNAPGGILVEVSAYAA
jgi:catechol 2,3-dioxygenase-like lactoylglutathione lyase family enzyme